MNPALFSTFVVDAASPRCYLMLLLVDFAPIKIGLPRKRHEKCGCECAVCVNVSRRKVGRIPPLIIAPLYAQTQCCHVALAGPWLIPEPESGQHQDRTAIRLSTLPESVFRRRIADFFFVVSSLEILSRPPQKQSSAPHMVICL